MLFIKQPKMKSSKIKLSDYVIKFIEDLGVKHIFLISGGGNIHRQYGDQEVNIVDIVKPLTKYAVTVMDPKEIGYHLEKAVYIAKSGRPGPVWIDIPLDIQGSTIET